MPAYRQAAEISTVTLSATFLGQHRSFQGPPSSTPIPSRTSAPLLSWPYQGLTRIRPALDSESSGSGRGRSRRHGGCELCQLLRIRPRAASPQHPSKGAPQVEPGRTLNCTASESSGSRDSRAITGPRLSVVSTWKKRAGPVPRKTISEPVKPCVSCHVSHPASK